MIGKATARKRQHLQIGKFWQSEYRLGHIIADVVVLRCNMEAEKPGT